MLNMTFSSMTKVLFSKPTAVQSVISKFPLKMNPTRIIKIAELLFIQGTKSGFFQSSIIIYSLVIMYKCIFWSTLKKKQLRKNNRIKGKHKYYYIKIKILLTNLGSYRRFWIRHSVTNVLIYHIILLNSFTLIRFERLLDSRI